jgi:uncharacterized radical SAM superfamily protein
MDHDRQNGTLALNPCELEIDLFCKGLRIDPEAAARIELSGRTRAGLGSGLELILPGTFKDIWVNVPVREAFAKSSPFQLRLLDESFSIEDQRTGLTYPVRLNSIPRWYRQRTSRGVAMSQVGVLQGTYLGIYIGPVCRYWKEPVENCKFCTTGLNVGESEVLSKSVEDVVETCLAARRESDITFVHFNSGYQQGRDLGIARPFLEAVKKRTGLMVGIQLAPVDDFSQYDDFIKLGADHFSFCFEFMNERVFKDLCPGKSRTLGRQAFFRAMEYTSSKMGKGRVSGEIIAGVEPIEDTLRAIDLITDCGAFPTICVFRPVQGSDMEDCPPPSFQDMRRVFRYMIQQCIRKRIPVGIAPNIEVSLVAQPTDALYLVPRNLSYYAYRFYGKLLSSAFRPVLAARMRRAQLS